MPQFHSFTTCVFLGKSLNYSEPQFPYLWNEEHNNPFFIRLSGGLNVIMCEKGLAQNNSNNINQELLSALLDA